MVQARSIVTPHLRAIAIASILPRYADVEKDEAIRLEDDLQKQAENMRAFPAKVHLQVSICNAMFATNRIHEAQILAAKAMDLGAELFKQDRLAHPEKRAYTTVGFDDLLRLAEILGKSGLDPAESLEPIQQVREDPLRAAMLITFGKGLLEAEVPNR